MEEKINIAEILKDKPQGTKLYADAFGELSIEKIYIGDKEDKDELGITLLSSVGDELIFYNDGRYTTQGESILVPSKEMRDWEKFSWKRGNVLVNSRGLKILFDRWANNNYTSFYAKTINLVEDGFLDTNLHTLASEEEAKSFIKCIEEKLGGKLNRETLKIEKAQSEFKDGDIVHDVHGYNTYIIKEFSNKHIKVYAGLTKQYGAIIHKIGISEIFHLRLATEEEKQQLFDALTEEGKAWNAEKKMLVDLKPKVEFKPFDKVLVRNTDTEEWFPGFFEKFNRTWNYPYHIMNRRSMTDFAFKQCIPYEGNEHLLGTTKDVGG